METSINIGNSVINLKLINSYKEHTLKLNGCDFTLLLGNRFSNGPVFHESFKTPRLACAKFDEVQELFRTRKGI